MREIKFRAWDNFFKQMYYFDFENNIEVRSGHLWITYEEGAVSSKSPSVKIMQFAGRHDKSGREIYEGDILRFTHESVNFINTDARIAVEIPKIYYMIDNPYNHSFEVIGNIYENPELLKENSNDRKNLQKQTNGDL